MHSRVVEGLGVAEGSAQRLTVPVPATNLQEAGEELRLRGQTRLQELADAVPDVGGVVLTQQVQRDAQHLHVALRYHRPSRQ